METVCPTVFCIRIRLKQGLRGERSQTYPYMLSAKQGSIRYHFYNVFGMMRLGIDPRPPAQGANAQLQRHRLVFC